MGLAGVSPYVYLGAILFEGVCLISVVALTVQATRKYVARQYLSTLAILLLYVCYDVGLFFTDFGKICVFFLDLPYSVGARFDKVAFAGLNIAGIMLLLFNFEFFKKHSKRTKLLLFCAYSIFVLIPIINELVHIDDPLTLFDGIWLVIANLIPYLYHLHNSASLIQKIQGKMEKTGLRCIFYQGLFQLLTLFFVVTESIAVQAGWLGKFNALYFLRSACIVASVLFSYLGYFLPPVLRNRYES